MPNSGDLRRLGRFGRAFSGGATPIKRAVLQGVRREKPRNHAENEEGGSTLQIDPPSGVKWTLQTMNLRALKRWNNVPLSDIKETFMASPGA